MKILPWKRAAPESRSRPEVQHYEAAAAPQVQHQVEDRNYTDIITRALVDAATESAASAYVSALEIAAGHLGRAFAAARVGGPDAALFGPSVMLRIGRGLVEAGESAWYRMGRRLLPAVSVQVVRDTANLELATAGGSIRVPASRVLLPRWNYDVQSGLAVSPLSNARTLRDMLGKLEGSLNTEANAAVGYLLAVPADGASTGVEQLRQDLASLAGRIAVIESQRGSWGMGEPGARGREYALARMGPDFPASNVELFVRARDTVLSACGLPVSLIRDGDGTGQREAWRRYLHGTVSPLGRIVVEAAADIGLSIALDWDQLFASDIAGRARAFQSLVNGGMSLEAAAAASGILEPPE